VDGGWGYYDFNAQGAKPTSSSISFVNGTVLVAFKEAANVGIEIPQKIVDRAVASIKRQQKPDFTYVYGEYLKNTPMMGINRPGGSLGRSQVCNLGLRLWEGDEQITDNVLKAWLYRLYLRNGWLDIGRKRPVPHEAWMGVAGYFYYYGHYYAGLCIDQLQPEDRAEYRAMLAKLLIKHQEPNGCWWDYTLYNYHKEYGTAFALMSMQRCLEKTEKKAADDSRMEVGWRWWHGGFYYIKMMFRVAKILPRCREIISFLDSRASFVYSVDCDWVVLRFHCRLPYLRALDRQSCF